MLEGSGNERRHWPFLDMVRSGSALLVVLGHARGHYFPEFAQLQTPSPVTKAFYLLTGLQHEGVVLFFLVSGFLVGGAAAQAMSSGLFQPLRYLANRFVRIYLVLIPGLMLTVAIQLMATTWLAHTTAVAALPPQPWSWELAVCHLASLQGISCSVLVSNAPLWSLAYEWLLYLAAPIILSFCYARTPVWLRMIGLLLLAAILASLLPAHLQWSWVLFWALGAGAAMLSVRWPFSGMAGAGGLAATCIGMVASRLHSLSADATDLVIATGFALALASPAILQKTVLPRIMSWFANLSYSLYVIHLPVILLTVSLFQLILAPVAKATTVGNTVLFIGTVCAAIGSAAVFSRATERHTRRLQRAILSKSVSECGPGVEREPRNRSP